MLKRSHLWKINTNLSLVLFIIWREAYTAFIYLIEGEDSRQEFQFNCSDSAQLTLVARTGCGHTTDERWTMLTYSALLCSASNSSQSQSLIWCGRIIFANFNHENKNKIELSIANNMHQIRDSHNWFSAFPLAFNKRTLDNDEWMIELGTFFSTNFSGLRRSSVSLELNTMMFWLWWRQMDPKHHIVQTNTNTMFTAKMNPSTMHSIRNPVTF